ncbi:TetR/AcrR family transcriptional regulator [Pseudochrobactrum asaccharolyticum]|jgi:AcrR family transcriptional regulator|uniref:TetR family transcriptional regulator n=1 Tax=Pseudochrobactrum asaccharolyticum TaxID=354351 RepID=A0A366DQ20_9HYPH|nr:TetR/AcrR family transcriptional regulator [Pseudochrobactrum asaccharolyticum]MBX8802150.1 TetR/AcrR family transcriptional regulator [Ochrobactrum sp. MR28]MBX8817008.1 TetR/AcrR family transcriptional regulator [Ochrobactrum sp. MR31]MCF7672664.1 TetR/AcrR family transcriptional regulator [Bacillus subtilis]MDR2311855.1 TetR/AcrR family transcriptional regulator [Brucellaceae bacterium]MCF7646839.1 TetR/AcrR family transcriptional regulator [Pseudochrobactrum asaccharolyticum]
MSRTRATDFEEKQRGLLISAAEVFADLGMEKASMSLIANHAKVSKSLLYHYYPSKDELIFAIITTHLEDLVAAIEEADDEALDPRKRLRQLVGTVLECYKGADNQHKVQLNAAWALPEEQRNQIYAIERRIVKRFSRVLREINPELDNAERPLLTPVTMSLFGMINWVYMWFKDGGKITREDYADVATTLILEGIKAVR